MDPVRPWNHWYHCMGNTYGTWLPGSPKGFRTRHHREHVEGDYKNPPPKGLYDERYEKSKSLMRRDPIFLTPQQKVRAVAEFIKSFQKSRIEVAALSIDRVHFHVLARFPAHNPRQYLGLTKKESSAYMKQSGDAPDGGLWATRTECKPITDERHFQKVVDYILDHGHRGAEVWSPPPFQPESEMPPPEGLLID